MSEEKIIKIQNKEYDLNKLKDEELLVLKEYVIKYRNSLIKKSNQ